MTLKKNQSGFTLIELLVVIAIIGILASVVLASLNSARAKGNDAKVKAQLSNARAAAELFYSSAGSYGTPSTTCTGTGSVFADPTSGMQPLSLVANYPAGTTLLCNSTATAWAMSANLSSGFWCVDSAGASEAVTTSPGAVTVCP